MAKGEGSVSGPLRAAPRRPPVTPSFGIVKLNLKNAISVRVCSEETELHRKGNARALACKTICIALTGKCCTSYE